jgi:DNA-binding XRE family transcriptional regulator
VPAAAKDAITKLEQHRRQLGITQDDLARFTGLSRTTMQRLLRGDYTNPPLRYLVNCQLAMGLDSVLDLCEPEWLEWYAFDQRFAAEPPDPEIVRGRSS